MACLRALEKAELFQPGSKLDRWIFTIAQRIWFNELRKQAVRTGGGLAPVEQLDYKRAQILSFEGRPLIQLAFLSKVGAPVALCILQSYDGQESSPGFSEMRGMSSASWSKDGYEYLLIGGNDNSLIKQVAERYSAQL